MVLYRDSRFTAQNALGIEVVTLGYYDAFVYYYSGVILSPASPLDTKLYKMIMMI
jgi:hypothetical protein